MESRSRGPTAAKAEVWSRCHPMAARTCSPSPPCSMRHVCPAPTGSCLRTGQWWPLCVSHMAPHTFVQAAASNDTRCQTAEHLLRAWRCWKVVVIKAASASREQPGTRRRRRKRRFAAAHLEDASLLAPSPVCHAPSLPGLDQPSASPGWLTAPSPPSEAGPNVLTGLTFGVCPTGPQTSRLGRKCGPYISVLPVPSRNAVTADSGTSLSEATS